MSALSFTQVEIDGFRGLRSLNLEGLGRVNILVGQNNCGKTSVLEALSILCQPQNPREWIKIVRQRDFGGLDENILQSLHWCFQQGKELDFYATVGIRCDFRCKGHFSNPLSVVYKELSSDDIKSIFDSNENKEEVRGAMLSHLFLDNEVKSFDLIIDERERSQIYSYPEMNAPSIECRMLTPYSYQLNKVQLQTFSKQLFSDDIVELLKKFDSDIESIQIASFTGERAAIYIKHKRLGIVPLSIFGDATRRAVLLTSTLLSLKDGGVLLIDEVEVGIHISALANVFKWLVEAARSLNVQVFVTTHSLEALDAITFSDNDLAEEDIVVFRLKQTEEKTESKRLSGDLLHRLRFERGLDVR